ncbi:DinB family protein [Actinoplanes sp. NPDC051859]|uniref:mycothiol transferase n=1 Tax=Actinoplanes sp. NPDC051859 TaxID=3363909 RepID=UPI0037AFA7C9
MNILVEAFGRLPELVRGAVDGLSPAQLHAAPVGKGNPVGWLVWHLTRVQDSHVAELLDTEQIYLSGSWSARFGRDPDPADIGYGHEPHDVAAVRAESADALVDYYAAVHTRTMKYLDGLTDDNLARVIDESWDPPVTLGVRLVSVLHDDLQHAGQAAYARGLL